MFTKSLLSVMLIIGVTTLVGCSSPSTTNPTSWDTSRDEVVEKMPEAQSIVDIVLETEDVSILRDIVIALDLTDTLASTWPFTVFAPTNEAFTRLLSDLGISFEELSADEDLLRTIVTYHVLEGAVPASAVLEMDNETTAVTLGGESITIYNQNGVVIDESNVIATDITASNGVIHLIDAVLIPASIRDSLNADWGKTIVTTAIDSGNFPTLIAAIQAAWLVDVLNGDWPFTVFAPTEEAFVALLAQLEMTAADLLADTELLTSVLTYHVLPWIVTAEDVLALNEATSFSTVQWTDILVNPNNGLPTINNSTIVDTNIFASNGIIHVIDTVLIPGS